MQDWYLMAGKNGEIRINMQRIKITGQTINCGLRRRKKIKK